MVSLLTLMTSAPTVTGPHSSWDRDVFRHPGVTPVYTGRHPGPLARPVAGGAAPLTGRIGTGVMVSDLLRANDTPSPVLDLSLRGRCLGKGAIKGRIWAKRRLLLCPRMPPQPIASSRRARAWAMCRPSASKATSTRLVPQLACLSARPGSTPMPSGWHRWPGGWRAKLRNWRCALAPRRCCSTARCLR